MGAALRLRRASSNCYVPRTLGGARVFTLNLTAMGGDEMSGKQLVASTVMGAGLLYREKGRSGMMTGISGKERYANCSSFSCFTAFPPHFFGQSFGCIFCQLL